jgi:acyl-CoA reductase-like NAD-dependent aldehyde dehydrogenase
LEAGLPPGILNILTTSENSTPAVSEVLLKSDKLAKISFTGSTKIGKLIRERSGLKRLSLELGGNAPFILMSDLKAGTHEWNLCLDGIMKSKFRAGGQACIAANRIFVPKDKLDDFLNELIPRVRSIKLGHGTTPGVQLGPLMRERDVLRVKEWIGTIQEQSPLFKMEYDGSEQANQISCLDTKGHFMPPVIISGLNPLAPSAKEEIFGPVFAIYSYETEQQLLEWANNSRYGLAGYFYTSDYRKMIHMSEQLDFGMIGVNESLLTSPEVPFGGIKDSGYGKEGSELGIQEYLQVKLVAIAGIPPL